MSARIWMTAALLSQLSAAALCSDKAAEKRQLEINRSKWASHGIKSYQFRLRDETCFCMYGPYYGPIRVIVNDGKVTKAIYEDERRDGYWFGRIVREKTELIATVDEVFGRAENLIKSASNQPYKIRYDPVYGFPNLLDVESPPGMADAQWRLVVDGFVTAKK